MMKLIAHLHMGEQSQWQQICQGNIIVADVWGKVNKYEWVDTVGLIAVMITDDTSTIGFFWVNEVVEENDGS